MDLKELLEFLLSLGPASENTGPPGQSPTGDPSEVSLLRPVPDPDRGTPGPAEEPGSELPAPTVTGDQPFQRRWSDPADDTGTVAGTAAGSYEGPPNYERDVGTYGWGYAEGDPRAVAEAEGEVDLSWFNTPKGQQWLASVLGQPGPGLGPRGGGGRGGGGGGAAGAAGPTAAERADAVQQEVEALLASQFGGFSFFLQKNRTSLNVGLTADGEIVAFDSPDAVTVKNVLDVIVEKGIVAPTRVLGILQNTEWWQDTDTAMRQFDVVWNDLSEPGKLEYLEPILDTLNDEAQFLGFTLDPGRAFRLARQIAREGEAEDLEHIRGVLTAEAQFDLASNTLSDFTAARDGVQQLARSYYVPIGTEDAGRFAEEVYVGERSMDALEQYFKEQAIARFPTLENAIRVQGITPSEYFAPYRYEIEQLLGRPNVDILNDYPEIIEFIPDVGGAARPMTLAETRTFIRGTDEWQSSPQAQDRAQALAFAIGRSFGEVA